MKRRERKIIRQWFDKLIYLIPSDDDTYLARYGELFGKFVYGKDIVDVDIDKLVCLSNELKFDYKPYYILYNKRYRHTKGWGDWFDKYGFVWFLIILVLSVFAMLCGLLGHNIVCIVLASILVLWVLGIPIIAGCIYGDPDACRGY